MAARAALQATDMIDPALGVTIDAVRDLSPKLVKALGWNRTATSFEKCMEIAGDQPGVIGKLIIGVCRELTKNGFMDGASVVDNCTNGLNLDDITAFGFFWTLAKKTGMRDVVLELSKMPCTVLKKIMMTIPLGGKLWAAVDMTVAVPVKIVELAMVNVYRPLIKGVSGALEPCVGVCGGVVCVAGVLPLVAGDGVQGVVSLTGDGVVTILWGAGEVIEGILGPLGTPIKFTVNVAGAIVDTTLKVTGAVVGGILSAPFKIGKGMMSVMK